MTLAELNEMSAQDAADHLKSCCGSQRWAEEMSARRPFSDIAELHSAADLVWKTLDREDWLEVFGSHPKIGETREVSDWSRKEQEGMATAANDTKARLARLNREYQERFGFIFIICATGKSADEMVASLEERLQNNPEHEMRIAGQEQVKIVHLRLKKLVDR
jgi:OHCU decarboxylase